MKKICKIVIILLLFFAISFYKSKTYALSANINMNKNHDVVKNGDIFLINISIKADTSIGECLFNVEHSSNITVISGNENINEEYKSESSEKNYTLEYKVIDSGNTYIKLNNFLIKEWGTYRTIDVLNNPNISFEIDNTGRFVSENGYTYYYQNGEIQKGIIEVDGNKYLLGVNSGILYYGWATTPDNSKYYSDENGVLKSGVTEIDGKKYLFGIYSNKLYYGWATTPDNNKYYSDKNGELKTGFVTIKGKDYYFDEENCSLKTGWFVVNNNKYYSNNNGEIQRGIIEVDGNKYLLGVNSGILYYGWATTPDNSKYYSDENGVLKSGVTEIDGKKYLFGIYSNKLYYGWATTPDGNKYYSDKNGVLKSGVTEIDDKKYLFGVNSNILYYGWATTPDGSKYYSDENGVLKSGITEIDGKKYLFGVYSNKLYYGWATTPDGNTYYTNQEGIIQIGSVVIDGVEYKFDNSGKWLSGWKTVGDKKYFYYPNNRLAKGWVNITGKRYYFNEDGEMMGENVRKVIDISSWQDNINWEQVKNDGVDGAIIRVGWGMTSYDAPGIDSKFAYNISEVKRLNIPYALYIYGYAEYDFSAKNEAKFVKEMMEKYGISKNTYVFYDAEEPIPLSTYEMVIPTFIETMHSYGYNNVGVYGSVSFFDYGRLNSNRIKQYPVWVAQYYKRNQYDGNYVGWQYCSDGRINGINGNVDVNMFKIEFKN